MIGAKAAAGLFLLLALCGCAGAMSQREAVQTATASLRKYCRGGAACSNLRVLQTQKIKDRWLIEFDAAAKTFGVAVQPDGNTDISVWDKKTGAAR